MIFILILCMSHVNGHARITTQEFNSEKACKVAIGVIKYHENTTWGDFKWAECVKK